MKSLQKAALRLAQADMVFWLMPPLMVLLILGTLMQRWVGLYEAHQTYFSSFVFWLGPIPLPGGFTLLGLLSINLVLKFFLASQWTWRKAGINLTHIGALVLLIGGLLTALTAVERYMIIAEGQESPYMYDYIEREVSIFRDDDTALKIPFDALSQNFKIPSLPFKFNVLKTCENCEIYKREDYPEEFGETPLHGMAQFMALKNKPKAQDPEANISGVVFEISGLSAEQNGVYLAIEGMPTPIMLKASEQNYKIVLGKAQSVLPFSIALKEFTKDSYPGTDKARAFSSDIIVKDGAAQWPARVEMNKPLRYKGYTFFQSSFERNDKGDELSIFSVVENKGRLLPYIGTIILAVGLLLHILIVMREHDRREEKL